MHGALTYIIIISWRMITCVNLCDENGKTYGTFKTTHGLDKLHCTK